MQKPLTRRWRTVVLVLALLMFGGVPSSARSAPEPLRPALPKLETAPDIASYRIEARLDPQAKTVEGTERITYHNPSPDTLTELWLRLYLRAFRSKDTLWMRESGGGSRGYAVDAASLGDITVESLRLADGTDLLASTTLTDTLMRVPLAHPLLPGQQIDLDATWRSKLPRAFARTGYGGRDNTFFMVGQWYPKMAVYDRGHWDTEPWHANSEFFNDFGWYDVQVTVPATYVVAGVGVPAGEQPASDGTKQLRFTAEGVTDFAFAASPDFRTRSRKAGACDVVLYYLPEHTAAVDEYLSAATGALQAYSSWYGVYPHSRLTVVDVPDNAGGAGGMEYPTLVTGGTLGAPANGGGVSLVVSHEVGHQWWPMQTATNEAREPWLDEGLTEYSGIRYMVESGRRLGFRGFSIGADILDRGEYASSPSKPATLPAWEYSQAEYGASVYGKSAMSFWTLENVVGTARFRRALATYLSEYRYKHPTGADFRDSLERSLGGDLKWFFDELMGGTGVIDYGVARIDRTVSGTNVSIVREGAVQVPVDVDVTFASGDHTSQVWDGKDANWIFAFGPEDPVVRAAVDPGHKLAAELDVLDNSRATTALAGPAVALGGRLSFWTQLWVQLLGLFG